MKKRLTLFVGIILSLVLVSWGYDGHYAIAEIAQNHLSPSARLAVKNLLGHRTMADVASYADELRSEPAYKATGSLHYVNVPLGYSFDEFSAYIKNDKENNIYKGIAGCINQLKDPASSKSKKQFALEFLIHLVGDSHQHMHVSRPEDKGGNLTSVTFLNAGTNLHSLWDSGLLDHQHINYKNLATTYDNATPAQITRWQNDSVIIWLWESYQISTILYHEAEVNSDFGEIYYEEHMPIVKNRIEKAGIRLAGVLNSIYQ